MIRIFTTLLCLCLAQSGWAQLSEGGLPYSFSNDLGKTPPVHTTEAIDVAALLAEDEIDLQYNLPLRFAFGHAVQLNTENAGRWTSLPNGDRIWRLTIHCPDAVNINLLYDDFYLPEGSSLYLYNTSQNQVLGAFTSRNNKATGRFATSLVEGEYTTLEYYEPQSAAGEGRIQIAQIGHGYRDLEGQSEAEKASGDCQVNVNCSEGDNWQDEKKGVARIVMDGLYLCSGTLVNNTANDCKPLFLTANHCLMGGIKQDAIVNPDVSGYVFYWNYERPGCENTGPIPQQTTTGGTVLANAGIMETGMHTFLSSDFALIQLDENPRGAYDVFFNGWDATGAQGNTGVGIHHPAGDAKKISTHHTIPEDDFYYWALYWSATENGHSVTEGGSSGSALFRENGRIIGQLFGGSSVNCSDPGRDLGLYGKLSYSWTNDDDPLSNDPRRRLKDWLDPIGAGTIRTIGGTYDPCAVPKVYFKTAGAAISEENANTTDGCRSYRDYTYELGITPYPRHTVVAELTADGSADAGAAFDYELLTGSVSFNNVTNTRSFTLRVYDDAYIENAEDINLQFSLSGSNGLQVAGLEGASAQHITISSTDQAPDSHVQTVRNNDNPAEAYLGPFGTVYFQDPGSGGVMLALTNNSSHDYGCTRVSVDQAGGTANNSWATGTTVSKTFRVETDNPSANASLDVVLYYDDGEIQGWEWFNDEGLTAGDLMLLQFAGAAVLANEGSASSRAVTTGSYRGSDYTFSASLSGLAQSVNGLTMGRLSGAAAARNGFQLQADTRNSLQLRPNVTSTQSWLNWTAAEPGATTLRVINTHGQVILDRQFAADAGFNELSVQVSDWPAGLYYVQLLAKGQIVGKGRLIKQ